LDRQPGQVVYLGCTLKPDEFAPELLAIGHGRLASGEHRHRMSRTPRRRVVA